MARKREPETEAERKARVRLIEWQIGEELAQAAAKRKESARRLAEKHKLG